MRSGQSLVVTPRLATQSRRRRPLPSARRCGVPASRHAKAATSEYRLHAVVLGVSVVVGLAVLEFHQLQACQERRPRPQMLPEPGGSPVLPRSEWSVIRVPGGTRRAGHSEQESSLPDPALLQACDRSGRHLRARGLNCHGQPLRQGFSERPALHIQRSDNRWLAACLFLKPDGVLRLPLRDKYQASVAPSMPPRPSPISASVRRPLKST